MKYKNIFVKVRKYGLRQSIVIAKNKIIISFKNKKIKLEYYSLSSNLKLINQSRIQLQVFVTKFNFNDSINFQPLNNSDIALENHFFLLGNDYFFENGINWHFNSNDIEKSYPNELSRNIKILDFNKYGDYRITWELNRHHQFVWYSQIFFLTEKKDYLERIFYELNDWVDNNKPGYGINFVAPMEISIRLINWFIAFMIISKKTDLSKFLSNKIINSLLGQLLYLNDNLFLKRKFRNNHSIVEISGLILFQSIIHWDKIANLTELYNHLFVELETQFYSDGINFEHSPTYSRFTIESLLILLIFVKDEKSIEKNIKLNNLVLKYLSTLREFITPNYSVPLFSDCDNGRILFLGGNNKDFNDFRGFFDFCGIFFNNSSFFVSESADNISEETKWWCFLSDHLIKLPKQNLTRRKINYFPDGGYFIFKDEQTFFAFKSGYPGNINFREEYAPHIHNDILSFILYFNGEPIFIDSGTYTYNLADGNFRDYFRSVYAHSVIVINTENQVEHHEAFGAKNFPQVKIKMISNSEVEGELICKNKYHIKRTLNIYKNVFELKDEILSLNTSNKVEINFILHPNVSIIDIDQFNKKIRIRTKTTNYFLSLKLIENIDYLIVKEDGWISDFYNRKIRNEKLMIIFPQVTKNSNLKLNLKISFNDI